jgi:hypothetical protein
MQQINRLSLVACAAFLAACGGGGSDGNDAGSSQQYVVYDGSANKHVVLDGASTQFAVKSSSQKLVHLASGSELSNLLVAANGDILRGGEKIAAIVLAPGQDGKTIAALTCTGPAPNYGAMTIHVSSSGWTYQCASNTGGGSTPDSSTSESANACIALDSTSSSSQDFWVNRCSDKVWVSWFDQGYCSNGCGDTVGAGARETITKIKGNYVFAACFYPATPKTPGQTNWQGGQFVCTQ